MGGEWHTRALGELTDNFDSVRVPVKEADRRAGPYPYYGASGIIDYVDQYLFDGEYLLIAEDGENLRTRKTPIAFLARGRFWVNNHAHIVRGSLASDTRFLMYALAGTNISGYLTGSTLPKLTQGNMDRIPILTPPIGEQRAIARILGALDDKIELNRRMNETLEVMAQALFLQWRSQADHTPEGARISDLIADRVLVIGDGYRAKNDELGAPGLPFIRAAELKNGFETEKADTLSDASVLLARDKISLTGDVAFTSKGTVGRFARVSKRTPRFVYSPQICFWRSIDSYRLRPSLLYLWMKSSEFLEQIDRVAHQTDMAPYVSLGDQRMMSMPVFGPDQHSIGDAADLLLERQSLNDDQNKALAHLRDALLPKLISGELRVGEAERLVADVAG